MRDWDVELRPLKRLSPGADLWTEGGHPLVFLPALSIPELGVPVKRDALLWPHDRDGYPSRLFLSARVNAREALNWTTTFNLQGHEWHGWSWKDVANNTPLLTILLGHLRPFQ